MKTLIAILSLVMLSGCAHYHRVVEASPTPTAPEGVKVKIGSNEVKSGDTVTVYKSVCRAISSTTRGNAPQKCTKKFVGKATVVEVLDEKNAIVEPQGSIIITPAMAVETEQQAQQ